MYGITGLLTGRERDHASERRVVRHVCIKGINADAMMRRFHTYWYTYMLGTKSLSHRARACAILDRTIKD